MKTIKASLFIACLFFEIQICFSQNKVSFVYDAAGNRTSRAISQMRSSVQSAGEQVEITTDISETLADFQIHIYPNPTHGLIKVNIQNLPAGETVNINLYNLSGHLIVSKHKVTSSAEINITGKHNGVYLLKVIAGKEHKEWKIIKK